MIKNSLFPNDNLFWLYHCLSLLLMVGMQATIIILWRDAVAFNLTAGLIWIPLFTLAVLAYRYLYKKNSWIKIGASKSILIVVVFSCCGGFLVSALMFAFTAPFFWDDVLSHSKVAAGATSSWLILFQHILGNGLQTQIFIASWIFIYLTITGMRRIQATELINLRLQNSLKEVQLSNLINQLNPHFLFNALNNIRFTIYENPQKADLMLTALADILRYSLETSRHSKVKIEQELTIVKKYIDIIKIQMEHRLSFNCDVPEEFNNYLIPPMLLQLLIENAVKHGIDSLRIGGIVTLSATRKYQRLSFTVANSIPNKFPNNLPNNIEHSVQKIGIGLKNIEQRLALLYGKGAELSIAQYDSEFTVTLIIPCETDALSA